MFFLLFDIDGTLIHSGGAGARALNRAFKIKFDIDEAMAVINPHGQTDIAIVEEIFLKKLFRKPSWQETEEILNLYVNFLGEEVSRAEKYRVLPYVEETLDILSAKLEFCLGLATGNIERGARIKLERGGLNKYFPFGGFGSDHRERWRIVRRAVERGIELTGQEPDAVFVIGDTPLDIRAGRRAGYRTVGVATSIYSAEELQKDSPDFVISTINELISILPAQD